MRNDFERSEVLLGKLWRRARSSEELGLDEDLVANLEAQGRRSAFVGRSLIALLHETDVFFEVLVKLEEIYCKFVSTSGGKTVFGVDCEVWMETFVSEEWQYTSGGTWSIVESELGKRQELGPVVLLIRAV